MVNKVVFECLNILCFLKIIIKYSNSEIYIITEKQSKLEKIFFFFLDLLNFKTSIISNFYTGNIKIKKDEETIFSKSHKLSKKALVNILDKILSQLEYQNFIPINDKNLEIHLTKLIYIDLQKIFLRFLLIDHFVPGDKKIYLKASRLINNSILEDVEKLKDIKFQKNYPFLFYIVPLVLINLFEIVRAKFINLLNKKIKKDLTKKNKVLSFQSYTISLDRSIRSQPYWFNTSKKNEKKINYFVIYNNFFFKSKSVPKILDNKEVLRESNIFVVPKTLIFDFTSFFKILITFKFFFYSLKQKNFQLKYIFYKTIIFKNFCYYLKSFSEKNNFDLFIIEENYLLEADAFCSVSNEMKKKSISIQYSNLGNPSISMIVLCDLQIIFSENYKKIYEFDKFKPKEFYIAGDVFVSDNKKIYERSNVLITELKKKDVEFLICYFDERIDLSKYGNNSLYDNYKELELLYKYVLNDKKVGLLVKSQFIRYTPSKIYQNNSLINNLLTTGRYIELERGEVGIGRNDILPIEAALNADIVINHKYGATAGLEAALASKKVILLDRHGFNTEHDHIYNKANICFDNIDKALQAISEFRSGNNNKLGDWSEIVNYFCPFKDFKSNIRVENKITQLLYEKK